MTDTSKLTIARVRVLNGHTDPDTAYVVNDYPYGGQRCKIRFWVETVKGPSKGWQRFVRQTSNPKKPGLVWNKPHPDTYALIVTMYLDHEDHVQQHRVTVYLSGPEDSRIRHMGIYDQFIPAERTRYDALLTRSRRYNPTVWGEWDNTVAQLAEHIRQTGADPELVNGTWRAPERLYYLSDPAAYVMAARARLGSAG